MFDRPAGGARDDARAQNRTGGTVLLQVLLLI
jgi:hypothetical protein